MIPWVLGVDPGVTSGWGLLDPSGKPIAWGQTGAAKRRTDAQSIGTALAECRAAMPPTSAFDGIVLAVEGQFIPSEGGRGQKNRAQAVSILKTARIAGMWAGVAGHMGARIFDQDGIQPNLWRGAVWGGRWTTEQAKTHAVKMALHTWGIRVLKTHHHVAESMWIGSYALGALKQRKLMGTF